MTHTYAQSIADIQRGELYPPCPRCLGDHTIYVETHDLGGEYVNCPCCFGHGDAELSKAQDYIRALAVKKREWGDEEE